MTTQPADDDYPRQWWPKERREREEQRTEMEMVVSAMSDEEFSAFIRRTRGSDN